MTKKVSAFPVLTFAMLAASLYGQEGPSAAIEASHSEHVAFKPGGTIRLENSYGYVTVEGWDEPEVQVTVTKTTDNFYKPARKQQALQHMERLHVSTETRSGQEVVISTAAARGKLLLISWPRPKKRGVTAEYKVLVPRDSRLIIRHDNGYVWVSDLTGDINIHSHTGDMIVTLPDAVEYSIDARTRMGSISSDFVGKGNKQFLIGSHFAFAGHSPKRRVELRMGRGCITILKPPPTGPLWKDPETIQ